MILEVFINFFCGYRICLVLIIFKLKKKIGLIVILLSEFREGIFIKIFLIIEYWILKIKNVLNFS